MIQCIRTKIFAVAFMGICTVARADVQCPALFLEHGAPNLYYAVVFVDEASEQERDRLRSQVSPKLADIERDLNRRVAARDRIRLELLTCVHKIKGADLSPEEMRKFIGFKVVAVFWKSEEIGARRGLVQLAVPIYSARDGILRRDVEVVAPYSAQSTDAIGAWIEVLGQDTTVYRPFVSMGLATAYSSKGDWKPALTALCDSRVGLAGLASTTLRPQREALEAEIGAPITALMKRIAVQAKLRESPNCSIASIVAP